MRSQDWVPRSVRSKARELERAGNVLAQQLQRTPTDAEIAENLGVSLDDFHHDIERISNSCVVSLDERCTVSDTSGDQLALIDTIQDVNALDPSEEVNAAELKDRLADAIGRLPERERIVLALYYYEDLTLREIGEVIGVTESRVSQVRTKAVLRLKARLEAKPFVDGELRPVPARRRGPNPLRRVTGLRRRRGREVPVGHASLEREAGPGSPC